MQVLSPHPNEDDSHQRQPERESHPEPHHAYLSWNATNAANGNPISQ
jgi:hypothetical protein